MYRKLEDVVTAAGYQAESTLKIFGALTDANLAQAIAPGHRNLGQIAWHIVTSIPEMMNRTGLGMTSVGYDTPPPATAQEIVAGYRAVSGELAAALNEKWTDETLFETDDMYGEAWPRGFTMHAMLQHEVHHRAQMTVLLRQAGAKVPGVFGPSKEEWTQFGMAEPPY
jgi:uncharacterized damage-inducible protein DinB